MGAALFLFVLIFILDIIVVQSLFHDGILQSAGVFRADITAKQREKRCNNAVNGVTAGKRSEGGERTQKRFMLRGEKSRATMRAGNSPRRARAAASVCISLYSARSSTLQEPHFSQMQTRFLKRENIVAPRNSFTR